MGDLRVVGVDGPRWGRATIVTYRFHGSNFHVCVIWFRVGCPSRSATALHHPIEENR